MLLQTLTFLTMPISLIFWLWELWLGGGVGELPQHRAAGVIVTARSRTASSEGARAQPPLPFRGAALGLPQARGNRRGVRSCFPSQTASQTSLSLGPPGDPIKSQVLIQQVQRGSEILNS